jgi:hypothetical protein
MTVPAIIAGVARGASDRDGPPESRARRRSRLAVLYLLAVTGAAFAIPAWSVTAPARWYLLPSLAGLQIVMLAAARVAPLDMLGMTTRLRWLFVFLLATYLLLPPDPSTGELVVNWQPVAGWRPIALNPSGAAAAAMMCLQIVTVVLASAVVRVKGGGTDLVDGLRGFGLPVLFVYSIDHTLALLGGMPARGGPGSGGGRGAGGGRALGDGRGGRGMGAGHGQGRDDPVDPADAPGQGTGGSAVGTIARLLRGDVGAFTAALQRSLARAREQVARESGGRLADSVVHDVAIVTGISLMMMSIKILKILPGLPWFSGFKTLLFYPLYILAADLTSSRWGGTACGTIMGVIAFLQGDGRYGALEIPKHAVPGVVVDLTWPVVKRLPRAAIVYCALGFILAIARTSTEFLTVLLLQARSEVFLFPAVKLVPNLIAGTLSGMVTLAVLPVFRAADRQPTSADRDAGTVDRPAAANYRSMP